MHAQILEVGFHHAGGSFSFPSQAICKNLSDLLGIFPDAKYHVQILILAIF